MFKRNTRRIMSGVMSLAVAASIMTCYPAYADEQTEPEKYPYTMFAASDSDGAITINADNVCINGSIAANGTIASTSPNFNVNGTKTENVNEEMIYIQKKLNYSYFSGDNVEMYADDYTLEEQNININNPMDVNGTLEMIGNINLNSGIKALEDVNLNGEVKNTNNSVIFSETGDININTSNTNFSGLIYAPYGDIVIDTDNLNLNNVMIIGQTITIDCPSVNANYSTYMAEMIGTESDINTEIYAFGEYNSEANSIDIEWYTNYENGSYEIWISDDNADYISVGVVSDGTTYQYPITEDFEKRYFKVSLTTDYGEYIESVPFLVTKTEEGYSVDYLDSDEDGLADIYEIMLGTDINNVDSDDDGLTDYQEVYITGTDPTKYDSVTEGVSDAYADSDGDGLSNAQEIELGTDPKNTDNKMKFRLMLTGMLVSSTIAFTSLFANIGCAFAEETEILGTGQCGENVYWTLYSDGTLDLEGTGATYDYTLDHSVITEPEGWKHYEVSSEYGYPTWFDLDLDFWDFAITTINVGEGITRLGDLIFVTNLIYYAEEINLPDSLEEIGFFALSLDTNSYYEPNVINKFPENLRVIEDGAFYSMYFDDKIVLPESVEKIGSFAFNTSAKEYVIPQNVKEISPLAFGFTGNEDYVDNYPIYDEVNEEYLEQFFKFRWTAMYQKDISHVTDVFKADTSVTVYGYTDSTAETYANENNFEFVPLNEETTTTISAISTSTETTTTVVENTTTETSSETTSQNTASSMSGTTTAVSTTSKKSSAKEDSPKTGDKGIIGIGAVLLSALGMFCISKKRQ